MSNEEAQRKAGLPERPRGQRMGRGHDLDQRRLEKEGTPAMSGARSEDNEMFADDSSRHFGSDAVTPDSASPSTPGAIPTDTPLGQSGGEAQAKAVISNAKKS